MLKFIFKLHENDTTKHVIKILEKIMNMLVLACGPAGIVGPTKHHPTRKSILAEVAVDSPLRFEVQPFFE